MNPMFFQWKDVKGRGRGLTFDDVLIVPSKSDVRSRRDPKLTSKLTKTRFLDTPIISANMDTVTEVDMAVAMHKMGGLGILNRFATIEDQVGYVKKLREQGVTGISASIGVGDDFKERAKALIEAVSSP